VALRDGDLVFLSASVPTRAGWSAPIAEVLRTALGLGAAEAPAIARTV